MPTEYPSSRALTQLSSYKDQISGPIKKEEEEKGKVMPEDGHTGQGHLNYLFVSSLNNSQLTDALV